MLRFLNAKKRAETEAEDGGETVEQQVAPSVRKQGFVRARTFGPLPITMGSTGAEAGERGPGRAPPAGCVHACLCPFATNSVRSRAHMSIPRACRHAPPPACRSARIADASREVTSVWRACRRFASATST
jgi:hypothetical protein